MLTKQSENKIVKDVFLSGGPLASVKTDRGAIITLRDIRKRYGHANFGLNIDQLDLLHDQIHVIVGPNGSGKSTLLKIIALLEKPDSGKIIFDHEDISCSKHKQQIFLKSTGFVTQNPYLFNMDVFENVALGLKLRKCRREEIVAKVISIMETLEIRHLSKRKVRDLSKGEYQKVAIAQVLVLEPKIILMDEPMSNIDAKSAFIIEKAVRNIQKRSHSTVIMTTHSFSQAYRLSPDIISIREGRIVDFIHENVFFGQIKEAAGGLQAVQIRKDLEIILSTEKRGESYIAIDPEDIVISQEAIRTSARNTFSGSIIKLESLGANTRLSIDVGVPIYSVITRQSFKEMNINLGASVYVSFKVNSVQVI
jgi:molybdopterin-binding protein